MTENQEKSPRIDGYNVIKKMGGGMSTVYKVTRGDGNYYALKVLKKSRNSEMTLRFEREVSILAELNSRYIPKIYDIGVYQDKPYFVMDYIDGIPLNVYIKQKKQLREREAVEIVAKIAEIMAGAHERDIIHRDIKPGNIILVEGEPFVMDFGIAYYETDDVRVTQTGEFIGTLNYAPIEQVFGEKSKIGPWTDVYSMGATLYHMVTGSIPFHDNSSARILRNITKNKLAPMRYFNNRISQKLEWVIAKAMNKNHKKRYIDACDLLKDLDAILHRKPVRADKPVKKWYITAAFMAIVFIPTWLMIGMGNKTPKKDLNKSSRSTSKKNNKKKPFSKRIVKKTEQAKVEKPVEKDNKESLPVGNQWLYPKKLVVTPNAKIQTEGKTLILKCSKGPAFVHIKDFLQWQNYAISFEVKVESGEFGLWMRNFSIQFRNFMSYLQTNHQGQWFTVVAEVKGDVAVLRVKGLSRKISCRAVKLRVQPGYKIYPGLMGFGMASKQGKPISMQVRNIKTRRLD